MNISNGQLVQPNINVDNALEVGHGQLQQFRHHIQTATVMIYQLLFGQLSYQHQELLTHSYPGSRTTLCGCLKLMPIML